MTTRLKLLLAYGSIPRRRSLRTFMDVAGFPRRENVCSNIIAFYLDPVEDHGLGDLMLSSLIRMTGLFSEPLPTLENVSVRREVSTVDRKRLDVIVEHPEFVIGIENKIDHWLNNDLNEYSRKIDLLATGRGRAAKVVLSIRPMKGDLPHGFVPHTYAELWTCVRKGLGERLVGASNKWVTHLIDFMENTERIGPAPMDLKPTDCFFVEHEKEIKQMIADYDDFRNRLAWRVSQLMNLIESLAIGGRLKKPLWVTHGGHCLVIDLQLQGVESAAIDLWLRPSGWQMELFGRDDESHAAVIRIAMEIGQESPRFTGNNRYILGDWPLDTDLEEISTGVLYAVETLAGKVAVVEV